MRGSGIPPCLRTRSSTSSAVGDLGETPTVVRGSDQMGGGHPHVLEEHLVEVGLAVHLTDGADGDPGVAHVDDEVRDAEVTVGLGIGAGEQDAPVCEVRERATRGRCPRRAR
jgi:hypothetical protein